jgi:hypothetical protein
MAWITKGGDDVVVQTVSREWDAVGVLSVEAADMEMQVIDKNC